jgi:hypothetical protein
MNALDRKNIIAILMLSPLYFSLTLKQRLEMIHNFINSSS